MFNRCSNNLNCGGCCGGGYNPNNNIIVRVTTLPPIDVASRTRIYQTPDDKFWALNSEGTDWVQVSGSGTQKQSDWNVTDTDSVAYIKNKPEILPKDELENKFTKLENKVEENTTTLNTKVVKSVNGEVPDTQGNVTINLPDFEQVQSDWNEELTNNPAYIKNKPDLYTKTQIDDLLSKIKHSPSVSVKTRNETVDGSKRLVVESITYHNILPNTQYEARLINLEPTEIGSSIGVITNNETESTINDSSFINSINDFLKTENVQIDLKLNDVAQLTTFIPKY